MAFSAFKISNGVSTATYTVTEGSYSGTHFGYSDGSLSIPSAMGSIAPSTLKSVVVAAAYYVTSGTCVVGLQGDRAQDFFISATFEDGATLLTSAASRVYSGAFDITTWQWTQAKPARWDGSGTSIITLTF